MDGIWFLYLMLGAFPALIAFAAIYKYFEVVQASRWPSVPGKVVVSTTEARPVRSGGPRSDDTELRNFAKVLFEYKVATRTYRGDRVSISEDMGNDEVAETLGRYPVGKDVTVFYNPNRREQALLERDAPPGLWKGAAYVVLGTVGFILVAVFGFKKLGALVESVVPNTAHAPFVAACVGFALIAALLLWGFQRAAARTRAWPTVAGRIASSGIHEFHQSEQNGNSSRWRTYYRPEVTYTYDFAGVRYTGDKVNVAGMVSASTDALASRTAAKYPVGTAVDVHYNPDNPADSVLEPRVAILWLFWLMPAVMLALAYYVGYVAVN
jgi:hypothetical protein